MEITGLKRDKSGPFEVCRGKATLYTHYRDNPVSNGTLPQTRTKRTCLMCSSEKIHINCREIRGWCYFRRNDRISDSAREHHAARENLLQLSNNDRVIDGPGKITRREPRVESVREKIAYVTNGRMNFVRRRCVYRVPHVCHSDKTTRNSKELKKKYNNKYLIVDVIII